MKQESTFQPPLPAPIPASEEMELAVIMAVIAQSGAIADVAERLLPDMFVNSAYRLVYRAMTALHDREADIDMLSIENEMRLLDSAQAAELNGLGFIADRMLTVRNAAHIRTYAASVIRCWVLRRLCADMQEHTLKAHDPAVINNSRQRAASRLRHIPPLAANPAHRTKPTNRLPLPHPSTQKRQIQIRKVSPGKIEQGRIALS